MARKIYITNEMGIDERLMQVGEHNPKACLMWPWLLTAFDDWGRADASARRLKAQLFPMFDYITAADVECAIADFAEAGMIEVYIVDGKRFMAIEAEKWFRYQSHIRNDKRERDGSRYPAPSYINNAQVREETEGNAHLRASARDSAHCCASPSPSSSPSLSPSPSPSSSSSPSARTERAAESTPKVETKAAGKDDDDDDRGLLAQMTAEGCTREEGEWALQRFRDAKPQNVSNKLRYLLTSIENRRKNRSRESPLNGTTAPAAPPHPPPKPEPTPEELVAAEQERQERLAKADAAVARALERRRKREEQEREERERGTDGT